MDRSDSSHSTEVCDVSMKPVLADSTLIQENNFWKHFKRTKLYQESKLDAVVAVTEPEKYVNKQGLVLFPLTYQHYNDIKAVYPPVD